MFRAEQSISFYRSVMCCEVCRDFDITDGRFRERSLLFYGFARGTYVRVYVSKTWADCGKTVIDF
jgi:hypothetical protein